MQTSNGALKTASPEARKSFVHGERSFRAYLAGGNVQFLEGAKTNFLQAIRSDAQFNLARFYLGIAQTQLRETNESIPTFMQLQEAGATFDGQVGLQLAYAHIKVYEDSHYGAAEAELDKVIEQAESRKLSGLRMQAEALKVFLYSVMAGRLKDKERRPHYARRALLLGEKLSMETHDQYRGLANAVLFDTYNGLGIVWMRIGEAEWSGFDDRESSWHKSQQYYDLALTVRPNSVQVLQNIGTLRGLQAQRAREEKLWEQASALLDEAKSLYLRSLEINDHDEFPFYRLADIAIQQGKKREALDRIRVGRTKPGAVKDAEWDEVLKRALELPDTL